MINLIPRGTIIPTKKSQIFSTAVDNQPSGESPRDILSYRVYALFQQS